MLFIQVFVFWSIIILSCAFLVCKVIGVKIE